MQRKRVLKPLKVAVEWTPGARTTSWEELWRRMLMDVFRAMSNNTDLKGRDWDK